MKTEVGFINKKGQLEKAVITHEMPYQVELKLLEQGIGRSQVRFQRRYDATPDKLQSLADWFPHNRA
jgi:hypothetical protein